MDDSDLQPMQYEFANLNCHTMALMFVGMVFQYSCVFPVTRIFELRCRKVPSNIYSCPTQGNGDSGALQRWDAFFSQLTSV